MAPQSALCPLSKNEEWNTDQLWFKIWIFKIGEIGAIGETDATDATVHAPIGPMF